MTEKKKQNEDAQQVAFEKAFDRLEQILEKMNAGQIALDETMSLFEEADGLINQCNKRLSEAEKRVETLIKKRNGDLTTGADNRPETEPFDPNSPASY